MSELFVMQFELPIEKMWKRRRLKNIRHLYLVTSLILKYSFPFFKKSMNSEICNLVNPKHII